MNIVKSNKKNIQKKTKLPKIGRIQFNHIIVTTNYVGSNSNIITDVTGRVNKSLLSEVQTIIAAGPTAGLYTNKDGVECSMQPGDKVLIDTQLLQAKRVGGGQTRLINFQFDKNTGDLITSENVNEINEEDTENYIMISDREILMVLPK